jgi:CheY-like chemotaxis protein
MKKILLIENQLTQFKVYRECLSKEPHNYQVWPEEGRYQEILDAVKVKLTEGFPESVTRVANQILKEYVKGNLFDLFIIDYKLAGSRFGKDGIWLASSLREFDPRPKFFVPVLFLSGRPKNEQEISNALRSLTLPHDWIEKGYAAKRILDPTYFEDNVIPRIKKLFGQSETYKLHSLIEKFLENPYLGIARETLRKIDSTYSAIGNISENARELLMDTENYDDDALKKMIDKYNKKQ